METFVAFDLETTGLSPEYHRIIEIGAVKVVDGVVADTFHRLVNPGVKIPLQASRINHITDEMVKDCPDIESVFTEFLQFIDSTTLVAHNAQFDMGFLNKEARKRRMILGNPVECTVKIARKVLKGLPSYSLENLTRHFRIDIKNKHRALDDAMGTAKLYIELRAINKDGRNRTTGADHKTCISVREVENRLVEEIKNRAYLERMTKAMQLLESGADIESIAGTVGITPGTLANYCAKLRTEYGYNYLHYVSVPEELEKRVTDLLIAGSCRRMRDIVERLNAKDAMALFWIRLVLDKHNVEMAY